MANKQGFATYSLLDVVSTINHPDVGKFVLSNGGGGQITISAAGDLFSNTKTATGYVTVNKMKSEDGVAQLELPNNSESDIFMRKWVAYLKTCATKRSALSTLTVFDPVANRTITLNGVVPQKEPDEGYQQTAGNRTYALLYAEKIVK